MNIHNVDLTCPIKEPKYFSLKVIWGNHGIWVVAYGSYHTANLTVFETKVVLLFTRQWRAGVSHFGVHSVIEMHRKNNVSAASLFMVPIIEKVLDMGIELFVISRQLFQSQIQMLQNPKNHPVILLHFHWNLKKEMFASVSREISIIYILSQAPWNTLLTYCGNRYCWRRCRQLKTNRRHICEVYFWIFI